MSNNSKDGSVTLKVVCAIIFIAFVVSYVYFYQCDVLAMMQYAWSDGQKHYDRNVGAVVLSAVLVVITAVTVALSRMPGRYYALNFYPALLVLGGLTAVHREEGGLVSVSWGWFILFLVLLVGSFVLIRVVSNLKAYSQPLRSVGVFSHLWWKNFMYLLLPMVVTCMIGNSDRTLHTRLAVERLCMQGEFAKALETGYAQYDNDSSLTMLRAMALAKTLGTDSTSMIGENLFKYEITGNSRSLFPQTDKSCAFMLGNAYNLWQTIGFVPYDQKETPVTILKRQIERENLRQTMYKDTLLDKEFRDSISKPLCKPVAKDYLLCAYLLDKDLRSFVKLLGKCYVVNEKMPQHYREACVLYGKLTGTMMYSDPAVEADYADFLSVMRANRNPVLRKSALRDSYFGTYWYYYYENTKK